MPEITLLDQETIDKIAAGEVVDRPASVVKELVENAIDARATAITVEIKEGGISFIRITDNGCGIRHNEVPVAFLRHATSKIKSIEDLLSIRSLGFRGEALSSIAAVAQVELITKTYGELTGTRYMMEGSKEKAMEEVGAPEGTTFIVKNIFYNTPARRKFLKTAQTEAGYISDLMERISLSHPDVSFKFINNGQTKLHTSGNSNEKDLIYHIFGRDITSALLPVEAENGLYAVKGFIGKPIISRGNRNYENFFINGRYIKSTLISKAIEDGYKGFLMQRQYPFCVLYLTMKPELFDVNVHPAKMELRFSRNEEIYQSLQEVIHNTLSHKELIPEVPIQEARKKEASKPDIQKSPEPFEVRRLNDIRKSVSTDSPYEPKYPKTQQNKGREAADSLFAKLSGKNQTEKSTVSVNAAQQIKLREPLQTFSQIKEEIQIPSGSKQQPVYEQQNFAELYSGFLTKDARKKHKVIGQLFDTYWLIEYGDKLYIIDQHAAHEKVLYEKTMLRLKNRNFDSQVLSPPIILTLNQEEIQILRKYREQIAAFGYEIEPFGGKEYAIAAVPADFADIDMKTMFVELLDDFSNIAGTDHPAMILEKVASMSCKAAVKGRNRLSRAEAEYLIDELLELENPYQCPHGRPTIISMTKYEIEKKFKRIV